MKDIHIDYFLRRIKSSDENKPFITTEEEFNTPSKTLKEFVKHDQDCYEDGVFITYVFGKKEDIFGIARMKPLSFEDFKKEIINHNCFNLEEIKEYENFQVIYMSRAGVAREMDGLGGQCLDPFQTDTQDLYIDLSYYML